MAQGKAIENGSPGIFTDLTAKLDIIQQGSQSCDQFWQAIRINQPAIATVPDDFIDPLSAASDGRFSRRHRLKVNTTQAFIPAGQCEDRAAPHSVCDLLSTLLPQKVNSVV